MYIARINADEVCVWAHVPHRARGLQGQPSYFFPMEMNVKSSCLYKKAKDYPGESVCMVVKQLDWDQGDSNSNPYLTKELTG